jgi:hypothetical protein
VADANLTRPNAAPSPEAKEAAEKDERRIVGKKTVELAGYKVVVENL